MRFVGTGDAKPGGFGELHDAIQAIEERPLKQWVALAVWDDDGEEVSVISEAPTLEVRGYLLDAVYASSHWDDTSPKLEVKAFDDARDVRRFEGGRMDVVNVGGSSIGRGVFAPGWRWSESVKPLIGEETCPLSHIGYVVAGRMGFLMDDGKEFEVGAGEAIHILPGHDAWTVGEEPCVILEIKSADSFGRSSPGSAVSTA